MTEPIFNIIEELLQDRQFKLKVKYTTKIYKANEKILQQGKRREHIFLIKSGKVRITITSYQKDQQFLHPGIAEAGPGDTFGEFGLFDDEKASADVTAITDAEMILIDLKSFKEYLEENPDVGYRILSFLLKSLIDRVHSLDKTILTLYSWGMKAHSLDKHLQAEHDSEND